MDNKITYYRKDESGKIIQVYGYNAENIRKELGLPPNYYEIAEKKLKDDGIKDYRSEL